MAGARRALRRFMTRSTSRASPAMVGFSNRLRMDKWILNDSLSRDRKSTRLNSSHGYISYAVFCLKKTQTGSYTFWISSDDNSTLFLSTDETPAKVQTIAYVPGWTTSREWTKYAEQQSAPLSLLSW